MSVRIFTTGGTFDKEYKILDGSLYFKETHLPEILRIGRVEIPVEVTTLMLMDSTEMGDKERKMMEDACNKAKEDRIIITHGTDTMVKTATHLAKTVKGKTIVMTGAMIPYVFGSSDGFFNIGNALAFAQILPPGVYVAMNGRYFTWDNVRKNYESGIFEELNPL